MSRGIAPHALTVFFVALPMLAIGQSADRPSLITQTVDLAKLTLLRGNTLHFKGRFEEGKQILDEAVVCTLATIPTNKAWVALGWRQFLYWFADAEHRIDTGGVSPEDLVKVADDNWGAIEKAKPPIFMEERANNGDWVRQWRRALAEFPYS